MDVDDALRMMSGINRERGGYWKYERWTEQINELLDLRLDLTR